jgi:drug/metabolite transporter (DMT)-like permease
MEKIKLNAIQVLDVLKKPGINIAVVYILLSVVGGAVGQILLKKGMTSIGPITLTTQTVLGTIWRMATNPYVIVGLMIYVSGTFFWLTALSRVPLSYAYPFAGLSYVLMLIASWAFLHEEITIVRLIGSGVIIVGVLLVARS